ALHSHVLVEPDRAVPLIHARLENRPEPLLQSGSVDDLAGAAEMRRVLGDDADGRKACRDQQIAGRQISTRSARIWGRAPRRSGGSAIAGRTEPKMKLSGRKR